MKSQPTRETINREVRISAGDRILEGEISVPKTATGIVLFAHGSGSSRHSPRNQFVANVIREAGVGTLLFDLLTKEEEAVDLVTRHLRFDIDLLARRLIEATKLADQAGRCSRIARRLFRLEHWRPPPLWLNTIAQASSSQTK